MGITEIALLQMRAGMAPEDATLRSNLAHAKKTMQDYTGNTFYYFQQTENPSYIYIVGEWDSLDQHLNHFIPSAENQALLVLLKDQLTVNWLIHANVSHADLPLPKSDVEMAKARRGELVWSIGRHFVKEGKKGEFHHTFQTNGRYLQDFITEGTIGGGWRADKENDKEEWVLLCPYTSVEQHLDFAKTDGFQKYAQIKEYIDGAEIKHAMLLDI